MSLSFLINLYEILDNRINELKQNRILGGIENYEFCTNEIITLKWGKKEISKL